MTIEELQKMIDKLNEDMKTIMEAMAHLMETQKGGPGSGRKPEGGPKDDDKPEGYWDSDKTDEDGHNETSDTVPEYDEDSPSDDDEDDKR